MVQHFVLSGLILRAFGQLLLHFTPAEKKIASGKLEYSVFACRSKERRTTCNPLWLMREKRKADDALFHRHRAGFYHRKGFLTYPVGNPTTI
jgi:hypothetical protein